MYSFVITVCSHVHIAFMFKEDMACFFFFFSYIFVCLFPKAEALVQYLEEPLTQVAAS